MSGGRERRGEAPAEAREGTLFFLHIPRTGGTTLTRIIRRQYSRGRIYELGRNVRDSVERLKEAPRRDRSRLRCVAGHFEFGLHRLFDGPAGYLTFVRHPVARVISLYRFIRSMEGHHLHSRVVDWTLEEFATSDLPTVSNAQTRRIAGPADDEADEDADERLLSRAKANIRRHFVEIGVTGQFDRSLLLCGRALSWRRMGYWRMNVSDAAGPRGVGRATRERIRSRNQSDLELYAFARERLERKIALQGPGFWRDLRYLRAVNRLIYRPVGRLREVGRRVKHLVSPPSE